MKPSVRAAIIIFAIISLVHFLRVILQWKVIFQNTELPMWPSAVAFIVTGALAIWLLKENKKRT